MNELEIKFTSLLNKSLQGPIDIDENLIEEFGELCKQAFKKQFTKARDNSFRLRMSNIGKDIRQLQLDKEHGEEPKDEEFKLLVCYGDLIEALVLTLLKASGVNIVGQDGATELKVNVSAKAEEELATTITGTYDAIYKSSIDNKNYVIDIKSASPWAFDNKFASYNTLKDKDSFGYLTQGYGYHFSNKGIKSDDFGGLFVVNKVNGSYKYLTIPEMEKDQAEANASDTITNAVHHFLTDKEIPECPGVKKETWYKKETGNKVIADGRGEPCQFCKRKHICHPELEYKKGNGKTYYNYVDKDKEVTYNNN